LRHSPIKQYRNEVFVPQSNPADVAMERVTVVGHQLETSESETLVNLVELADAILVDSRKRVTLRAILMSTALIASLH
jgi:hypothetical protein